MILPLIVLCLGGTPNGSRTVAMEFVATNSIATDSVDPRALHRLALAAVELQQARTLHATTETRVTRADLPATRVSYQDIYYARSEFIRVETRSPQYGVGTYVSPAIERTTVCTPVEGWESTSRDSTVRHYPNGENRSCETLRSQDVALSHFWDRSEAQQLASGHGTTASAWDPLERLLNPTVRAIRMAGRERWNGASYDVIEIDYVPAYVPTASMYSDTYLPTRMRLYVDSAQHIRRVVTADVKEHQRIDYQVLTLALDTALSNDTLWTRPAGSKTVEATGVTYTEFLAQKRSAIVGRPFPQLDRKIRFLDGHVGTLREQLRGKNGAVIWYWSTSCSGCVAEFPHFEQLYRLAHDRGLDVIAVDPLGMASGPDSLAADSTEIAAAHRMQTEYGTTLHIALDRHLTDTLLATQLSTQLVDSNGVVRFAGGGVDANGMRPWIEALLGAPLIPVKD